MTTITIAWTASILSIITAIMARPLVPNFYGVNLREAGLHLFDP